jgi:hypothetical protein
MQPGLAVLGNGGPQFTALSKPETPIPLAPLSLHRSKISEKFRF